MFETNIRPNGVRQVCVFRHFPSASYFLWFHNVKYTYKLGSNQAIKNKLESYKFNHIQDAWDDCTAVMVMSMFASKAFKVVRIKISQELNRSETRIIISIKFNIPSNCVANEKYIQCRNAGAACITRKQHNIFYKTDVWHFRPKRTREYLNYLIV